LNKFRIPIGDWSADGHGICEYFEVSTAKDYQAVIDAFDKSAEEMPDFDPRTFCNKYQDSTIPEDIEAKMSEIGLHPNDFDAEHMAMYTIWFINEGDPDLNLQLEETHNTPMLHFTYNPKVGTSFIGYGLFGW
jgi:hypothetical protein